MRRVFHISKLLAIDLLPAPKPAHARPGTLGQLKRGLALALSVVEPKSSVTHSPTQIRASNTLWKEWREVESANATWEGIVSLVLMLAFAALLVTATLRS